MFYKSYTIFLFLLCSFPAFGMDKKPKPNSPLFGQTGNTQQLPHQPSHGDDEFLQALKVFRFSMVTGGFLGDLNSGGEGRSKSGSHPRTPWSKGCKGTRTRRVRCKNLLILKRRKP